MAYLDGWLTSIYASRAFARLLRGENTPRIIRAVTDTVNPDFLCIMYEENEKGENPPLSLEEDTDSVTAFHDTRSAGKEFLYLTLAFALFAPVFFALYLALFIFASKVFFSSAVAVLHTSFSFLIFLSALLTSAASAYYTKRWVISALSKNRRRRLLYHELLKSGGEARIAKIIMNASLLVCIVITVLTACRATVFYEHGVSDCTGALPFSAKLYEYKDIESADLAKNGITLVLSGKDSIHISSALRENDMTRISLLFESKGITVSIDSEDGQGKE